MRPLHSVGEGEKVSATSMRYRIYYDVRKKEFDGIYREFWTDHIPVCLEVTYKDLGKAKAALIEALKEHPAAYIRGEFRSSYRRYKGKIERHYLTSSGKLRMEKTEV